MALPNDLNDRWFQAFTTDAGGNPALNVVLAGGTVAGALLFPDGTQAAPSIAFASEPGLGFRYHGPGQITLQGNANLPALSMQSGASNALSLTFNEDTTSSNTNVNSGGFWTSGSNGYAFGGLNGQRTAFKVLTELTTISTAATTSTTIQAPQWSVILAISVRTVTVIPTAATYTVTTATPAKTWNTAAVSVAAGSTDPGTNAAFTTVQTAASSAVITPSVAPATPTGQVRTTIYYMQSTAPTS